MTFKGDTRKEPMNISKKTITMIMFTKYKLDRTYNIY